MDKIALALTFARAFLSPARRKALYLALGALGALAVTFGYFSDAEVSGFIGHVGAVLDALALFLAAGHTDTSTPTGAPVAEYAARHGE